MAPTKQRKLSKSQDPVPFNNDLTMRSPSQVATPEPNAIEGSIHGAVTQAQKQALIENLRLEVAERARKLRATYNLHTQNLRSRLEMRTNRIPTAYREKTLEELMVANTERVTVPTKATAKQEIAKDDTKDYAKQPLNAAAGKKQAQSTQKQTRTIVTKPLGAASRGVKRPSSEVAASDKENVHENPHDLVVSKKRAKMTQSAAQPAPQRPLRGTSQKASVNVPQILSPRVNNSQSMPKPPIKPSTTATQLKRTARAKATAPSKAAAESKPTGRVLRSRK